MIFKCFLVLLCTNVYLAWKLHNYISETLYTDKGGFNMNQAIRRAAGVV